MWDQIFSTESDDEYIPRILKVLEHFQIDNGKKEFLQSILGQCEYRKLSVKQVAFFEELEKSVQAKIDVNTSPDWCEDFWQTPDYIINKADIDY